MKKLINKPEDAVLEMLQGIALAHPELALDKKFKVIRKKALEENKVALLSGGGSGHEPAHAGFVGKGMLDAAVAGDVFASPSQIQVYQAIRQIAADKGVLLIIKNYSGDIMNFKNAAHLAKEDGILVDYVKVDDDIAVRDSLYTVGRRGVAGTVLVHKIAGAAAQQGKSLDEVKAVAQKTINNVKSIGFALSSCTVPSKGTPTFHLEDSEMEYGVGIHGEPGIEKCAMASAEDLAKRMVEPICTELSLEKSQRVALMVNGFGATPLMELYLFNTMVVQELAARDITIARTFVGNYMTSIDMEGASLSILKLDDELETLLNAPADTPALKLNGEIPEIADLSLIQEAAARKAANYGVETAAEAAKIGEAVTLSNMQYIVDVMSASIIRNEVPFCELDSHAGDGDFGMSVAKGFRKLKEEWHSIVSKPDQDIGSFLSDCSIVIMEHCGGASGPIWGSAFRAAGRSAKGKLELSVADFADMLQAAVEAIQETGRRSFGRGAVVGDKTLIDALVPCTDAWTNAAKEGIALFAALKAGAQAAVDGAESTKHYAAKMGRAGNVGDRSIGYPDAGAHALGVIFTDIVNALQA